MVKIIIYFGPGVYSKHKDKFKEVLKKLDYKYQSGSPNGDKLICVWNRKPENQKIRAIFNGSGKECKFIIECNDDEQSTFISIGKHFEGQSEVYNESSIDNDKLREVAKQEVDKWFTWQKPYRNEPELFYQKRIEKMNESYEWFIQRQIQRMRNLL